MARRAQAWRGAGGAGGGAGVWGGAGERGGVGTRASGRRDHQAEMRVSTSPLRGTGSGITTSKALTRSVATISSSAPRSYTSLTLPRTRSGKGRSVVTSVGVRAVAPSLGRVGFGRRQGKARG